MTKRYKQNRFGVTWRGGGDDDGIGRGRGGGGEGEGDDGRLGKERWRGWIININNI